MTDRAVAVVQEAWRMRAETHDWYGGLGLAETAVAALRNAGIIPTGPDCERCGFYACSCAARAAGEGN